MEGRRARVPELSEAEGWLSRRPWLPRSIYWGIHASCLLALWVGVSSGALLLCAATLFIRLFGITGGYHRYFSHRAYKQRVDGTPRVVQNVEFELEVEDVVPLRDVDRVVQIAADGAQLHRVEAVHLKPAFECFERSSGARYRKGGN